MRKFRERFGNIVDLDNPKTYKHLPKDWKTLDDMMYRNIGYALMYMDYFPSRKGLFPNRKKKPSYVTHRGKRFDMANVAYNQRLRVYKLIQAFADERKPKIKDVKWYQEQVFLFQEEIENMC